MAPPKAIDTDLELPRIKARMRDRFSSFGHIRCECQHCSSHLDGLAVGDVPTGVCGTCGSSEIAPLSR